MAGVGDRSLETEALINVIAQTQHNIMVWRGVFISKGSERMLEEESVCVCVCASRP